jgi:hypothetical protein
MAHLPHNANVFILIQAPEDYITFMVNSGEDVMNFVEGFSFAAQA